jgi:hypothetical protein
MHISCAVRKQKYNLRDEDENQQFSHTAIGSTSFQQSAPVRSLYHSTPAGLNVLSSIPVPDYLSRSPQNSWNILANGNAFSAALPSEFGYPIQNQENFWYGSAECIDLTADSKQSSRNQSPLAGE